MLKEAGPTWIWTQDQRLVSRVLIRVPLSSPTRSGHRAWREASHRQRRFGPRDLTRARSASVLRSAAIGGGARQSLMVVAITMSFAAAGLSLAPLRLDVVLAFEPLPAHILLTLVVEVQIGPVARRINGNRGNGHQRRGIESVRLLDIGRATIGGLRRRSCDPPSGGDRSGANLRVRIDVYHPRLNQLGTSLQSPAS